ncbi:helicase C-terminal domain-containing protein [Bacteriovorax sp. PP10]|uniref:Helicase C-terminal domain-containing protein n=1 Tax=Bacteriovorax antarcticus TaxID=3088717 RepID=A0ABU5VSY0_9BACT|nr:helicase C-terminal domain-containing protein [Bacteriovorax sp. PP10]MEA9356154.1 helicase C-terminal domain-containing protein [Bacteriovorax sp. PP10]
MDHRLSKWAVIDVETTGADASYDQVIDLGFLLFEGTKLVQKYSSLVQYPGELSSFIQKLTGITPKMLSHAPTWREVEKELQELYGVKLIAHNSDFEQGFLKRSFDKIDDGTTREEYCDTMLLLGLLFPEYSSLKLEHFIQDWKIAETETHRGYEDSLDLLKVVLVSAKLTRLDKALYQFLKLQLLEKKILADEFWLMNFLHLSDDELYEIASQIDFDLDAHTEIARIQIWGKRFPEIVKPKPVKKNFDLAFSGQNIKDIFNNEEKIKEMFPLYRKRQAQIDLAVKAGQSLKNSIHSLIQAPTGTGKTFGYLIPAVLFSMEEKKPVLIATGTKTLQHQAFDKDVPQVREFLGLTEDEMKIKLLVGSNNHLCESLFRQEESENSLLGYSQDFDSAFTSLYFETVFFHNSRAKNSDKLIRDDLPYVLKRKNEALSKKEKEIAVDFRSCSGNNCPFKNNCSYIGGLRDAREANIIIGNHSLMFSWPKGMPRPLHIVVDEAHKIEEEATKAYSLEIDQKSFEIYISNLQHLQGVGSLFYLLAQNETTPGESSEVIKTLREETLKAYTMLMDHLTPLGEKMGLYFKRMPKYTELFWNELPMINRETHKEQIATSILNSLESVHFILETYMNHFLPYAGRFDVKNLKSENEIIAFTRWESFFSQLSDYVLTFENLLKDAPNYCRSMKYLDSDGYLFSSSPVDVGRIVNEQLLKTSASVIFTSATLANGTGDTGARGIEWATGYSYLEPERRFKTGTYLPFTFDYKKNTKVFLCDDGPSLYQQNFVEHNLKTIKPLIQKLGGRTLLLFSAKSRFEVARELLLREFEGQIPLFIQGMGTSVVEDFKRSGSGILLGMESFGEGIDIPGDALQFIFVDKVPDLRMDLVINERRDFYESHLGNEFTDYYLAHRTRSLHQKLGRLLRTERDYGGVIIVDNRVKSWKGKTMEKLVKLMEPYNLERATLAEACEQIGDFILNKDTSESESTLSQSDHSNT